MVAGRHGDVRQAMDHGELPEALVYAREGTVWDPMQSIKSRLETSLQMPQNWRIN